MHQNRPFGDKTCQKRVARFKIIFPAHLYIENHLELAVSVQFRYIEDPKGKPSKI